MLQAGPRKKKKKEEEEEEEKEEEKESSYINHAVCNSHFNDHQIQFIWW
jgi:hypothetical protein